MVTRWIFTDPFASEAWEVPINPREMGSPFTEKNVSIRTTSAIDGQALMFEARAQPQTWTFTGAILDAQHYADLKRWSEKRNRITITDHYGRVIPVYLTKFEPTPKRSIGKPWRHEYTMTALVVGEISDPVVV